LISELRDKDNKIDFNVGIAKIVTHLQDCINITAHEIDKLKNK